MEFSAFFLLLLSVLSVNAQQTYINNKQLDCYNYKENTSFNNGFFCSSSSSSSPSCLSYLTFRSQPPYDSAAEIGYLLNAQPNSIARINNITDVDKIPVNTRIIVPVNCSCSDTGFYQHNSSYTLKYDTETYFIVANDTYQGLTTCQSLMNHNPYNDRKLTVGMGLSVPLRCACPSTNQTADGFKFLLTYLITWGESVASIAQTFGVDEQTLYDANELDSDDNIYPFTTFLVPLKNEPTKITDNATPPSPSPPPPSSNLPGGDGKSKSSKKWVFVGIGVGLVLLGLCAIVIWYVCTRRSKRKKAIPVARKFVDSAEYVAVLENKKQTHSGDDSVPSGGVRHFIDSLSVYTFEELEKATGYFAEDKRIKGSVFHGVINGDNAAIKRMRGDVSSEINILKQINHCSVIRLSGFCVNEGNTYLVYEFAENGSLSDWLHATKSESSCLEWKERVQIAYDVADGLNYLHNYTNPPYIHKDLKSSNILLTANFRAKIANFGLARTLDNQQGNLHLTRHVVGTQGYMAPEYIENGVVTPKLDVFAFGVVMLELLSGKEAANDAKTGDVLLCASIKQVLEGDNVREELRGFIDASLKREYPLDLAFSMAQLAMNCVDKDLNSRPTMADVFMSLSKILSSSLDWDPSDELGHSRSLGSGR
ncbi:hypothetical protein GIB67_025435 [Kingdonia uniflora]|uniref:Uncharacterized protein n=1 Tax=Kingdonia uniflora TaxID=39325 RepID=A0A7J7N1J5_9MAGN|nr:hypothetical protein GIB67_025435 [Kingdonia uniflora]